MAQMRRADRMVVDAGLVRGIVERARVLRIGACDDEGMFVVPVSFGYIWEGQGGGASCASAGCEHADAGDARAAAEADGREAEASDASACLTPMRPAIRALYIHSAAEGRKARAFSRGADVAFEMDVNEGVIEGASACAYSCAFCSIMGTGRVAAVEDADEKRRALALIMEHMAPGAPREFPDAMVKRTAVFRIDVRELCAKRNPSV